MGLHDIENILSTNKSTGQAVTVTANSEDLIDLGDDTLGLGYGFAGKDNIWLTTRVIVEDFATGTSMIVSYTTDSDVAFGSAVTLFTGQTILVADLTVGAHIASLFLPSVSELIERYIRATYTVAGAAMTAGRVFTSFDQAGFSTNV